MRTKRVSLCGKAAAAAAAVAMLMSSTKRNYQLFVSLEKEEKMFLLFFSVFILLSGLSGHVTLVAWLSLAEFSKGRKVDWTNVISDWSMKFRNLTLT